MGVYLKTLAAIIITLVITSSFYLSNNPIIDEATQTITTSNTTSNQPIPQSNTVPNSVVNNSQPEIKELQEQLNAQATEIARLKAVESEKVVTIQNNQLNAQATELAALKEKDDCPSDIKAIPGNADCKDKKAAKDTLLEYYSLTEQVCADVRPKDQLISFLSRRATQQLADSFVTTRLMPMVGKNSVCFRHLVYSIDSIDQEIYYPSSGSPSTRLLKMRTRETLSYLYPSKDPDVRNFYTPKSVNQNVILAEVNGEWKVSTDDVVGRRW